jgi:hypothetical protein
MEQLALIVLGAVVGALSTGGATAWDAWRQRRERRRVAARVVLGDLYVLEGALDVILEARRWPDRLDLQAMVETWRGVREAFASGVAAWEWAVVDGVFSNLHRVGLMVRLSEPCTERDQDVVRDLRDRIPRAREVVLGQATSERERGQLVEQLTRSGP